MFESLRVEISDFKAATPTRIALSKLRVGRVEYSIKEREVVLDLLVSFHVEAILRLLDGSLEV